MEEVTLGSEVEFFVSSLSHTATVEEYDSEEQILDCEYATDPGFEGVYFHDEDGDYVAAGKWALIY